MQQQTATAVPAVGPVVKPAAPVVTAPGLDKNIAAELAAADVAASVAESPVAVPGQPQPPQPPTAAEEVAALLHLVGQGAGMVFPSLAPIYSEGRCKATGEALAPALERLGVRMPVGVVGVYAPAAIAVITLAWETRIAVTRDLEVIRRNAEQAAKKAKAEGAAVPAEKPAEQPAGEPKKATEADVLRPTVL